MLWQLKCLHAVRIQARSPIVEGSVSRAPAPKPWKLDHDIRLAPMYLVPPPFSGPVRFYRHSASLVRHLTKSTDYACSNAHFHPIESVSQPIRMRRFEQLAPAIFVMVRLSDVPDYWGPLLPRISETLRFLKTGEAGRPPDASRYPTYEITIPPVLIYTYMDCKPAGLFLGNDGCVDSSAAGTE